MKFKYLTYHFDLLFIGLKRNCHLKLASHNLKTIAQLITISLFSLTIFHLDMPLIKKMQRVCKYLAGRPLTLT